MPAYTEYKNKKYARVNDLRVWELKEIIKISVRETLNEMEKEKEIINATPPDMDDEQKFIFGIRGLANFLNIPKPTATHFRRTIMRSAVSQVKKNGNLIFDAQKVKEIYKRHKEAKKRKKEY